MRVYSATCIHAYLLQDVCASTHACPTNQLTSMLRPHSTDGRTVDGIYHMTFCLDGRLRVRKRTFISVAAAVFRMQERLPAGGIGLVEMVEMLESRRLEMLESTPRTRRATVEHLEPGPGLTSIWSRGQDRRAFGGLSRFGAGTVEHLES